MIEEDQKLAIQSSLWRLNCRPVDLMERFYDRLFEIAPATEKLFKGNITRQYEKLLNMIMLVTHSLDNLTKLVVAVEELGGAHVRFGVQEADYEHVGAALLHALSTCVDDWSKEDEDAWTTLYDYLSDLMITGGRGLRAAS